MRVLLAPDKFAGTLSAVDVCDAFAAGWHDIAAADQVSAAPMSDGGPGFIASLATAAGVTPRVADTVGPHGALVSAQLLLLDGERPTAFIEAASCCGLALSTEPRRPLEASSVGLARLIEAAVEAGATRIVIGVGGTATTDGGRPVYDTLAGSLPPELDLVAATDVDNPLLGPAGAARSFGPQKGATDAQIAALEQRLSAWAAGADIDPSTPGAGAGGGLAFGLMRLGARRVSGAAVVAEAIDLDGQIAGADLVVTGEGGIDFSSLRGKVVAFVAGRAQELARPCIAVTGYSTVGRREAATAGIDEIYSLVDAVGRDRALAQPAAAVRRVGATAARDWSRR
ncbi:MAG TPA: glycerate kinase [Actinomycetes bacterium]|nr:glycerate kinase [Actinomycetes bacterium]